MKIITMQVVEDEETNFNGLYGNEAVDVNACSNKEKQNRDHTECVKCAIAKGSPASVRAKT